MQSSGGLEAASGADHAAVDSDGDGGGCEDVRGKELMPYDDGSLSADKGQSNAMSLVINYTEPVFAAGAAVFGLGLLVLPLLSRLNLPASNGKQLSGISDLSRSFSYDPITDPKAKPSARLFSEPELKKRLGLIDAYGVMREIVMTTDELDDHVNSMNMDATDAEIKRIQKWREKVNSNLKCLQKRSALAFLGLPPDAGETDVAKMYKKMALELHPDKGGDPEKFQELQEMKERLNQADEDKKVDENDEDEEARKMKKKAEEEDPETQKLPPDERAKKLRMDAHDNTVRLWDRAKKSREEICGDKAIKANSQPALNLLRSYVDRFVTSEIKTLRHDDPRAAHAKFNKFIHNGAEIIAVAAINDVQSTLSTIAMNFNYRLVARSGSAEMKARCAALLEAVAEVPVQVETFLKELEDLLATVKDRERMEKEQKAARQREREAKGDFRGDVPDSAPTPKAPAASRKPAEPAPASNGATARASPTEGDRRPVAAAQADKRPAATPKADPFSDFDFGPSTRPAPNAQQKETPVSEALARDRREDTATDLATAPPDKRTCWDPNFDHPYAGALKTTGTGIFCRPCQRWINSYEYNVEVFLTHVERVHPRPPPGFEVR